MNTHYLLVQATLAPSLRLSPDRLAVPLARPEGRYRRIANIDLLRAFRPPATKAEAEAMVWAMCADDALATDLLMAGVMGWRGTLLPLLAAGPLRHQLSAGLGENRFLLALRYGGESPLPCPLAADAQDIKAMGMAIMHRFLQSTHQEAARRLWRRMPAGDPCLDKCIQFARRANRDACKAIGERIMTMEHQDAHP